MLFTMQHNYPIIRCSESFSLEKLYFRFNDICGILKLHDPAQSLRHRACFSFRFLWRKLVGLLTRGEAQVVATGQFLRTHDKRGSNLTTKTILMLALRNSIAPKASFEKYQLIDGMEFRKTWIKLLTDEGKCSRQNYQWEVVKKPSTTKSDRFKRKCASTRFSDRQLFSSATQNTCLFAVCQNSDRSQTVVDEKMSSTRKSCLQHLVSCVYSLIAAEFH